MFLMQDSGARGNRQQIKQLAGMRGLMAKPSGEIIERPITSNFREGLSVLEYFISTHGARKGLADTALKTADSGYLTRKLVDAAQDVIIVEPDCGTANGILVRPIYEGDDEVVDLATRIVGRVSCETIGNPVTKETIIKANQLIEEGQANALMKIGVEQLKIRSVLTCESKRGVCAQCYGRNLATGRMVKLGEAVGIIAAQSIGEPGTQLTMRTFHIGGTATQLFKQPIIKAKNDGNVHFNDLRVVQSVDGNFIVLNKNGSVSVHAKDGREFERYNVVIGSVISVADGAPVKKGDTFVQWDPYNVPILTERTGRVEFRDMIPGVTVKREIDEATGRDGHRRDRAQRGSAPADRYHRRQRRSCRQLLDSGRCACRRARNTSECRPVRCWPRHRGKLPRPRTSPAVCRGWRNCSRRGVRKMRPRSPRSTG